MPNPNGVQKRSATGPKRKVSSDKERKAEVEKQRKKDEVLALSYLQIANRSHAEIEGSWVSGDYKRFNDARLTLTAVLRTICSYSDTVRQNAGITTDIINRLKLDEVMSMATEESFNQRRAASLNVHKNVTLPTGRPHGNIGQHHQAQSGLLLQPPVCNNWAIEPSLGGFTTHHATPASTSSQPQHPRQQADGQPKLKLEAHQPSHRYPQQRSAPVDSGGVRQYSQAQQEFLRDRLLRMQGSPSPSNVFTSNAHAPAAEATAQVSGAGTLAGLRAAPSSHLRYQGLQLAKVRGNVKGLSSETGKPLDASRLQGEPISASTSDFSRRQNRPRLPVAQTRPGLHTVDDDWFNAFVEIPGQNTTAAKKPMHAPGGASS